ncbi:hypothetical protein ACN6AX_01045 [Paenibacillus polymyxa]|uniref:hypothetical protein n=1 Tax=Paenibacillus polymyxa TaxID=1406 RepID=UPI00211D8CE9|nr:hypothetical protein [Paenibacillus polymyxa]
MTQQTVLAIIQKYVSTTKALRANTAMFTAMLAERSVQDEALQRLWQERDELYDQWYNAAVCLRGMPEGYAALAIYEMEQLQDM